MNAHLLNKRLAQWFGLLALLPYMLLSLAGYLVHSAWLPNLVRNQLGYGIAILSFMGGIHWGAAFSNSKLNYEQTRYALICGVGPALLTFIALLVDVGFCFLVQLLIVIGTMRLDRHQYALYGLPDWMLALRQRLTQWMVAALVLTFIAVNWRS